MAQGGNAVPARFPPVSQPCHSSSAGPRLPAPHPRSPSDASPASSLLQELTFEVGPCGEEALQLHAALYSVTPDEATADDFVASGRWGGSP